MKSDNIIFFNNVSKKYRIPGFIKHRYITAVDGLSFEVKKGEFVGLLGLNAAGKTTTMKLISGIVKPDSGVVEVFGSLTSVGNVEYKKRIGYLCELPYFYPYLTARKTLEFYYSISSDVTKSDDINSVLSEVGLLERADDKIKGFSKGMMQRLAIACSIIHNPDLLILDEPASGLDPLSINDIRNLLLKLNENGKTIFLSSHSISDVEKICKRVIIMYGGKIIKEMERKDWENSDLEKIFIETVSYELEKHKKHSH
ncbi:MAG: ABC transporter ATP-binding protein [Elusimicrobiales bacterium]|nr:ABC transporter ATP-binding protein [Elusimicrobiales bacterium]